MNKQSIYVVIFILTIPCLFLSCDFSKHEQKKIASVNEMKNIAKKINDDFITIRKKVKELADNTALMYQNERIQENLAKADRSKYRLNENGIFHKPQNDGDSAVFVSGIVKVNETIKDIVYFTEPLDPLLKKICDNYPEVTQAYYNNKDSYNRIYPYFDVLMQYEPKLDIPSFNFYYLADQKHNPEKKSVWVNEPYVDPAGRGWMVSAIAPVYVDEKLEGVCGIDVTIMEITNRYIPQRKKNLLIVDSKGKLVSIHEQLSILFSLPPLTNHEYIDTIQSDTFRPDDYNLLSNKLKSVRMMAKHLIVMGENEQHIKLEGNSYTVLAETISELNWRIIKVLE
ncbi:PDC sensor domain-containing protein [Desulfosarcina ovata]|uniref:hypothetical protein n=1 Tax=Desulfosarcina ovata TaxID=83564 RepID=UPI0012D2F98D|nr:hypothetical protein [Desulfosarcina ovata]